MEIFREKIHKNDYLYNTAKKVKSQISSGKYKIFNESEVL